MEVVTVEDLVVSYGGRPVLDHVSLTVDTAETLAILGANGSGKSTLIRAALGLVPPVSGTVKLFGTPLRKFKSWRRIG